MRCGLRTLIPFLTLSPIFTACQGTDVSKVPPVAGQPKPSPTSTSAPTPPKETGDSIVMRPMPKAALSNMPPQVSASLNYEVKVGGSNVATYLYAVVEGRNCDDAKYSEKPEPLTTPIKGTLVKDGEHSLCVKGVDATGMTQEVATSYLWKIDRAAPTVTLSNPPKDGNKTDTITSNIVGMNAAEYAWTKKMGTLSPADCEGEEYSDFLPLSQSISSAVPDDGNYTLCIKGKSQAGIVGASSAYTWLQDRNDPGVMVVGLPKLTNAAPFEVNLIPQNRAQFVRVWVTNKSNCNTMPNDLGYRSFEGSGALAFGITAADLKQMDCDTNGVCTSGLKKRRLCVEASKQSGPEQRKAISSMAWDVDLSNPLLTLTVKNSNKVNITDRCAVSRTASIAGNSTKCPSTTASLLLDIATPVNQQNSEENLRYRTRFVADGIICPTDDSGWSNWVSATRNNFPLTNVQVSSLPIAPGKYTLCTQVEHKLNTIKILNAGGQTVWLDRVSSNITAPISTASSKLNAAVSSSYRYALVDATSSCAANQIMSNSLRDNATKISDALGIVQNMFFKLCILGEGQSIPTELVFFVDNVRPSLKVVPPAPFSNANIVKIEFEAEKAGMTYAPNVDAVSFALVNYNSTTGACAAAPAAANFSALNSTTAIGSVDVTLADSEKNNVVKKCLYARDRAGNNGFGQVVEWTHDNTVPATPTVSGMLPTAGGRDSRVELKMLEIGGADIVDARTVIVEGSACPTALPAANPSNTGLSIASIMLPNSNNTAKSLCVFGIDRAENFSVYSLTWTYDNTAPVLSLSGIPNDETLTAAKNITVTLGSNEAMFSSIALYEESAAQANYKTYCTDKLKAATYTTALALTRSQQFSIAVPTDAFVYKIVCATAKDAQGNIQFIGQAWKVSK